MSTFLNAVSALLLAAGCFVALTSALGVLRMPDFFTRIHAAGKSDTLAQLLICAALALQAGFNTPEDTQVVLKLILISGFLFLTTPASTHAIAKAAWEEGLTPWTRPPEPQPETEATQLPPSDATPSSPSDESPQGEGASA